VVSDDSVVRIRRGATAVADHRLRDPGEARKLLLGVPASGAGGMSGGAIARAAAAGPARGQRCGTGGGSSHQNQPSAIVSVVAVGDWTGSGSRGQMAAPCCIAGADTRAIEAVRVPVPTLSAAAPVTIPTANNRILAFQLISGYSKNRPVAFTFTAMLRAQKVHVQIARARVVPKRFSATRRAARQGALSTHPSAFRDDTSRMARPGARFAEASHWRDFYGRKAGSSFEWYVDASVALQALARRLPPTPCRLMHAGCGTSRLGSLLSAHGHHVDNVDFEPSVVEAARALHKGAGYSGGRCTYHCHDLRRLPAEWSEAFDAVIDKGGLCAAAFAGEQSAASMLRECARVVRPGGVLFFITDDPPEIRSELLIDCLGPGWSHPASAQLDTSDVERPGREEIACSGRGGGGGGAVARGREGATGDQGRDTDVEGGGGQDRAEAGLDADADEDPHVYLLYSVTKAAAS